MEHNYNHIPPFYNVDSTNEVTANTQNSTGNPRNLSASQGFPNNNQGNPQGHNNNNQRANNAPSNRNTVDYSNLSASQGFSNNNRNTQRGNNNSSQQPPRPTIVNPLRSAIDHIYNDANLNAAMAIQKIKALIENQQYLEEGDANGNTPLHSAVLYYCMLVNRISYLFDNEEKVEVSQLGLKQSLERRRNLYWNIIQILIDERANVNAQNNAGETPLDIVCHYPTMTLLVVGTAQAYNENTLIKALIDLLKKQMTNK